MKSRPELSITKAPFGTAHGKKVDLYTLANSKGLIMSVTNYGGTVVSLLAPDRDGHLSDIVLGCATIDDYLKNKSYLGCIVGRYGNRIGKARFSLEGKEYRLAVNNGNNNLHGGNVGFDKVIWDGREVKKAGAVGVELNYLSKDGEENFPGNLTVTVTYWLTENNEFAIDYSAKTDKTTIVNLTNHTYWNLAGEASGDVCGHEMQINADAYTPVDAGMVPTGEIAPVKGTPMDFRKPTPVGARIDADFDQLRIGAGYDHNWVINRKKPGDMVVAAIVHDPKTGRVLQVSTTEPGVQFYAGNFLDGSITGKSGKAYQRRSGLCLETQHFPDSPNKANFPSVVLRPGEQYSTRTVHTFSVK